MSLWHCTLNIGFACLLVYFCVTIFRILNIVVIWCLFKRVLWIIMAIAAAHETGFGYVISIRGQLGIVQNWMMQMQAVEYCASFAHILFRTKVLHGIKYWHAMSSNECIIFLLIPVAVAKLTSVYINMTHHPGWSIDQKFFISHRSSTVRSFVRLQSRWPFSGFVLFCPLFFDFLLVLLAFCLRRSPE